jgi:phosphoserine phosphatase
MTIRGRIILYKKIVVIDLDGTFVSVNSFHKWMLFLIKQSLKKRTLRTLLKLMNIIRCRALKKINHAQMKYAILEISEKIVKEREIEQFVKHLDRVIHQGLLKIVEEKKAITILATGAPEIYAKKLSQLYGFDYHICTPSTKIQPWRENLKEVKKENLLQLLQKENLPPHVDQLFTDHHDDLPLMRIAKKVYLVNPSEETLERVTKEGVAFELLGESHL